jgi:hypothetical protein
MEQRRAAERPQGILQAFGQRDKALAAEHDMAVLPAREGKPEVIKPVIQRHPSNADAAITHVGKIGQPEPPRRVLLAEDHLPIGTMQRPPGANTPLQRAPDAGADLGMPAPDLVEDGDRPQARDTLEQRHHLAVPNATQRVGSPPAARRLPL